MRLTILPLAAAAAILLPASADAMTYCVGDTVNCTGAYVLSVDEGLKLAKASTSVADTVHLGKGVHTTAAGLSYVQDTQANDLHIEGEGSQTILKADVADKGNGFKVLSLIGAPGGNLDTFVSELKIEAPNHSGGAATAGLFLANASAEYMTIAGKSDSGAILGFGGRMRFGAIAMDDTGDGVSVLAHGAKVEDMKIAGANGVDVASSGALAASRLDITSTADAITCHECDGVTVDSTILRIGLNGNGINATAIVEDATVDASHLTVFGAVATNGRTATAIRSTSGGGGDAAVNVDNSVFFGVTRAYAGVAGGVGEADITAFNNNYTVDANIDSGAGQLSESGRTSLGTGFVAPLSGDFHLGPNANQIDKGRPNAFVGGLGVDIDLQDRAVDAPDQGADEYQKHAPLAMVGGPAAAEVGEKIALSGAKSGAGGDPGDSVVTYAWDFKDGTPKATGAQVEHAWSKPGTYAVILEITDKEGQVDTTVHDVVVSAAPVVEPVVEPTVQPTVTPTVQPAVQPTPQPAVTPTAKPGTTTPPAADRAAPRLTLVRVSKKSFPRGAVTTLGWTVSEDASLVIAVRKGRKVVAKSRRSVRSGLGTAGLQSLTKKLEPGRYVLHVTATDAAGNRSALAKIKVTVRR